MKRDGVLQRIWIDPARCGGKACIRGHRIWVSLILEFLANGETIESLLELYPQLEQEDIMACIAYGSEMARGNFTAVKPETA